MKHGQNVQRGVLYISIGAEYSDLTAVSIGALRATGYSGPVRIVTDDTKFACDFSHQVETIRVEPSEGGFFSRHYKTALFKYAFDECLFLDSDTIPISHPGNMWHFLQNDDIHLSLDENPFVGEAIRRPFVRDEERSLMMFLELIGEPHFNSGVLLFRKSAAVEKLFAAWHGEWSRFQGRDQLALVRAIAATGQRVGLLPETWNYPPVGFNTTREARRAGIKILHFFLEHRERWADFAQEYQLLSALGHLGYTAGGDK